MSENVIRCPNCGAENQVGDHFCSNCGTRLIRARPAAPEIPEAAPVVEEAEPQPEPTPPPLPDPQPLAFPSPVTPTFSQQKPPPPADAEENTWRMSSLGPPPRARRRIWLWIVIGLIAACLIVCVAAAIFLNTNTGQNWLDDVGTSVAKEATKQAGN